MGRKSRKVRKIKNRISNSVGIEIGVNSLKPNSNISDEDILKIIYRLDQKCSQLAHPKGNCTNIPQCLKGLIQSKDPYNLASELKKLGKNPAELFRPENTYIGLDNLGATCYMNSLLQCLFMNQNFRNCVYMWKRDDDTESNSNLKNIINEEEGNSKKTKRKENLEDSICFQLQLLFGTLQYSMLSSYSPHTLISLLNIKTSIQQDAQEFNKLFITYLEERFNLSNNEVIKSFVKNEFQGKYSYNTTCKVCNQSSSKEEVFYELELNIQNSNSLEGCLLNYIKEEELVGDNKYDCPNCKLVEATRKMTLLSLPPTLNFQLIRYQFDLKSGKKKIQNKIEFPTTLNMTNFLADKQEISQNGEIKEEKEEKEENIYELTAILMHLGQSAYGGHYIAHIKDVASNKWWKFNDSSVSEIKSNEVGEADCVYDNIQNTNDKHKKVNEANNSNTLSSSNAYMLIYTRKNREMLEDVLIPPAVADHINAQNSSLVQLAEDYEIEKQRITKEIKTEKEFYQKVMSEIAINSNENNEYQWIDLIWFSKFARGEKNIERITNENLLCPHDKVDPKKIDRMKQISDSSAKLLFERYGGGPVLTQNDCCYYCAISYYDELIVEREERETRLRMIKLAFNSKKTLKSYIVPIIWMNNWRKQITGEQLPQPLDENVTASITCSHKQLAITDNKRYVTEDVWNYLKTVYPKTEVEFPSTTKSCTICVKEIEEYRSILNIRSQERLQERKKLTSLYDSPVTKKSLPPAGQYYLIPYLWHSEWKNYINDPHIADRPEIIDNSSFICEHNKLILNPVVFSNSNNQNTFVVIRERDWHTLMTLYEGGPEISFVISDVKSIKISPEICAGCKALKDQADFALRLNYKAKSIWITTNGFGPSNRYIPKKLNLTVDSEDTIVNLKMKIMERLHLTPVEQQISYNDQILDDANKTLADYGILPGYTLELCKIECERVDEQKKSQSEEAFEQSIFISKIDSNGYCDDDGDDNGDDDSDNMDDCINDIINQSNKWSCSTCTFLNDDTLSYCELCHKKKPSTDDDFTGWSCNTCTYNNPISRTVCEVCKTRRS